jgi:2-polyprenyl-3-methyl-5-hydroxy-6-metoxy-1,4-benzoquinol methylase
MKSTGLSYFLDKYLRERPVFLALIRAKEAWLYQKFLPFNKPVVDLGCGDGFFTRVALGGAEIGIDLPDSRINEVPRGIYKRLITYNGRKIPLPAKTAGTVITNSVLEHVEDLNQVLREIFRILKPGGMVIAPVMAAPWEDYLFGAKIFADKYKKWMRKKQQHVNLLTRDEWRRKFEKAGFKLTAEIGHLNPVMCTWMDVLHYVSLPYLISYKLTSKWTIIKINPWSTNWFKNIIEKNVDPQISGGEFFVWKKPVSS